MSNTETFRVLTKTIETKDGVEVSLRLELSESGEIVDAAYLQPVGSPSCGRCWEGFQVVEIPVGFAQALLGGNSKGLRQQLLNESEEL